MQGYIDNGFAEEIPPDQYQTKNKINYLPHFAVVNPLKPKKLRIVFDCAARYNSMSLNDNLMKGPDLVNSLIGVLMRFRSVPIVIIADVEAMFHQIKVTPSDRDALRFLWWPRGDLTNPPLHHRMKVHLFGARSSPSVASFCLKRTVKDFGHRFIPDISRAVREDMYVDDLLTNAEDEQSGIQKVKHLKALLNLGGFNLTKWLSTSPKVTESIPIEDRSSSVKNIVLGEAIQQRVLGLNWNIPNDEFRISTCTVDGTVTKRRVLSITNSLFDPLGFVAPVVLEARLIFRELCRQGLQWDEEIFGPEKKRWVKWCNSLSHLNNVSIGRYFLDHPNRNSVNIQLHFFSDASESARGSVCYIRLEDKNGDVNLNFVMGRSLLADKAARTMPRLELEAALDAVKLSKIVKRELNLHSCSCLFWTDSMIVLDSLRADKKSFPKYARNRLSMITDQTCSGDWRYVPTNSNVADQASRGTTAELLLKYGNWLNGPSFLKLPPQEWPIDCRQEPVSEDIHHKFDLKEQTRVFHVAIELTAIDQIILYFSTLHKLKIATAWILRIKKFLQLRAKKLKGEI